MTHKLDFLIIGAQKAGTTTLFKLLQGHPQISMPPEKEAPFFTFEERYQKGLECYLADFFAGATGNTLWGKASPQYLADPRAALRIHASLPEIKLIAVLRNPIERAFSHYRMAVRRSLDSRTFEEAVTQAAVQEVVRQARGLTSGKESESLCYLVWGEYGRLLETYLSVFPRQQLLVLFTEDLESQPGEVLKKILHFLGIEQNYSPANLGARYHVGGIKEKHPNARKIVALPLVRSLWNAVPGRIKRPLRYWFHQYNVAPDTEGASVSEDLQVFLTDFFMPDVRRLENLLGCRVPWGAFQQRTLPKGNDQNGD